MITHGGCNDGHTAAWLISLIDPGAEFVPARHDEDPPDVTGRRVVMADFAYKRPVMEHLLTSCDSMLLLDHHQSAREDLAGLEHPALTAVFDMDRCGSRIVMDHFADELRDALGPRRWELAQQFVAYIDDRDRWVRALPKTDEWSAGLASHDMTFESWSAMAFGDQNSLISDGEAIERYRMQRVDLAVERAIEAEIAGHLVLVSNCDPGVVSEVGARLAVGRPFSACYIDMSDSRRWSLRSTDDGVDVAHLAERFGGGGHPRAAGFRTDRDSWPVG
ncbi:MAG: DHHA1 domain-containing protein [Ilumatobacteraceae bacterium]